MLALAAASTPFGACDIWPQGGRMLRAIQSRRRMPSRPRRSFEQRIEALVRGQQTDLASYLHEVETKVQHAGTEATLHCYSVALDGASMPRVVDLAKAICMRVV